MPGFADPDAVARARSAPTRLISSASGRRRPAAGRDRRDAVRVRAVQLVGDRVQLTLLEPPGSHRGRGDGSAVLTKPEISQNDKHDDYDPNDVEDVAAHVCLLCSTTRRPRLRRQLRSKCSPVRVRSPVDLGPSRLPSFLEVHGNLAFASPASSPALRFSPHAVVSLSNS